MSDQTPPEHDDQTPQKKSSQQLLLLVLLLLVALFGYLYFFTSVIRPRVEAPQPQPVQTAVKKPLPPRPNQKEPEAVKQAMLEEKGATPAVQPPSAKGAAAKPEPPGKAAAGKPEPPGKAADARPELPGKAAPTKDTTPKAALTNGEKAPAAAAKKETVASAPRAAEKPAAATQAREAQSKQAPPAKKGPAATPVQEAKAGAPLHAKPPVNQAQAQVAGGKPAQAKKKTAAAAKPSQAGYTLEITGDLLESEMGAVTAKLKKAGIDMIKKSQVKKGEVMHRLFLADFANHDEALEEVERLRQSAPDAFMLNEKGRYAVYAGSYLRQKKAALEQDRLYDKGVKLLLRDATAPVSVLKVRAGCFTDVAAAEKALRQLKKAGLDAKVVKTAK